MARRPSLALLIIVAGSFFLIGLYTAFLQGSPPEPEPVRATQAHTPVTSELNQSEKTILLIGVDDLTASQPSLEALWFLSFRPPVDDLFLLGIPLDLAVPGDPPAPIRQYFNLGTNKQPSQDFLDALYREIPLELDAVVILDETGFASAIDFLGGVPINEANFTGQEVLGIISLTEEDPSASLSLQRRLLAAMSQRAQEVGASPEITPLVELMPEHLYLSISINKMVELLAPIMPIHPESTHFELY